MEEHAIRPFVTPCTVPRGPRPRDGAGGSSRGATFETMPTPIQQGALMALVITALGACRPQARSGQAGQADTAFASLQARGQAVMGVDQYTSAHVFEDLVDGGRIVLDRDDPTDTAGIAAIRQHMKDIAAAFRAGDFAKPFAVHAEEVPGTAVMTARRAAITYTSSDRPRGAAVRIVTTDTAAIAAVHAFLEFQRTAHHAAGHDR